MNDLSKTLECIYIINQEAAESRGREQKLLYELKERVLNQILEEREKLAVREDCRIDGKKTYLIKFKDEKGQIWSFHAPIDAINSPIVDTSVTIDEHYSEREYEIAEKEDSLRIALMHFLEEFGINANNCHPSMPENHQCYKEYLKVATCSLCGFRGTKKEIALHKQTTHDESVKTKIGE